MFKDFYGIGGYGKYYSLDGYSRYGLWAAGLQQQRHNIERYNTQQETSAMSVKAGDTLDGMTVEQLRDLAKRAEAAAKVQEEKKAESRYVALGHDGQGGAWRYDTETGEFEFEVLRGAWRTCYSRAAEFIRKETVSNGRHISFLISAFVAKKVSGEIK